MSTQFLTKSLLIFLMMCVGVFQPRAQHAPSIEKSVPAPPNLEPKEREPMFRSVPDDPVVKMSRSFSGRRELPQHIQELNRQALHSRGLVPFPTAESIRQETQGKRPPNSFERPESQKQLAQIEQELNMLNHVSRKDRALEQKKYYQSPFYKKSFAPYVASYNRILAMLEGRAKLSIKDAFYQLERAYGNLHLSKGEYDALIEQNAAFIKAMILEAGFDLNDQQALHWAIQKFMGDTVTITIPNPDNICGLGAKKTHLPYIYDYIDNMKFTDFRDYFVTKTLATGSGQCHTLPSVYLILAEAVGAEVFLSYAPQHSFIKYRDSEGRLVNYEPTVDWHFTDQDYLKERPIMAKAIENGFYINALGKKEIVAHLMVELAHGFYRKNWFADGNYITNTISKAAQYLNNGRANQTAQIIMVELRALEFDREFRRAGLSKLEQIRDYPRVQAAFDRYRTQDRTYRALGLQDFPEEMYLKILEKYDKREKLQLAKGIDTKTKKDLFVHF